MEDHTYLVTRQFSEEKVKKIAMLAGEIVLLQDLAYYRD